VRAVLVTAVGAAPELAQVADPAWPPDGVVVAVEATGSGWPTPGPGSQHSDSPVPAPAR
jgi:hypothetical protein